MQQIMRERDKLRMPTKHVLLMLPLACTLARTLVHLWMAQCMLFTPISGTPIDVTTGMYTGTYTGTPMDGTMHVVYTYFWYTY